MKLSTKRISIVQTFAFSLYVGLRYTRSKRKNHFISFISLVSTIGIALGVMVLITVLSVMNGFDKELKERLLGMAPHITLYSLYTDASWPKERDLLLKLPLDIQSVTPFIEGGVLLSAKGKNHFLNLQGIEPALENEAINFDAKMLEGKLSNLQPGEYGIVLGKRLVDSFGLRLNDKLTVIVPEIKVSLAGIIPRIKQVKLVGVFELGYEFDSHIALMHLNDSQKLFRYPTHRAAGFQIRLSELYQAPQISKKLMHQLPGYQSLDWTQRNGNFFKAVKLEKKLMFILLFFIVLVAAFNILATLVMVVSEKESDIAILRAMGADRRKILGVFLVQGITIGLIGILIGTTLGLLLAYHVSTVVTWLEWLFGIHFLSPDVYYISTLPSKIELSDVMVVILTTFSMSFLFTVYPAWRASKIQISEALRYE